MMLRHKRAFTLPEVLVTAAIAIVVLGVLILLMLSSQGLYLSMDTSIQAQEQVRLAFMQVSREVQQANGNTITTLNTVCANCGIDFQLPLDYQSGSVVWGAVDKDGQDQAGWHVQYRLDTSGGQRRLIRVLQNAGADVAGEPQRVLANWVDPTLTDIFQIGATTPKTVRVRLQVTTPQHNLIPGRSRTSGVQTLQTQLRNPT